LIVNEKPNGGPLVARSHAEAMLSGRAATVTGRARSHRGQRTGDVAAVVALFGRKQAALIWR